MQKFKHFFFFTKKNNKINYEKLVNKYKKMLREVNIKGVKWIDAVGLRAEKIKQIAEKYDFHELDIEACLEENQRSRIDVYDNYLFILLNFPKYNIIKKLYEQNEFNIFLGKDFIITFRDYNNTHIDKIFDKYSNIKELEKEIDDDEEHKLTSAFILYEILQSMLEKLFKVRVNISKDLKILENNVFNGSDTRLVKDIMIKKRNIVVLKHMLKPQIPVLKLIEFQVNKIFDSEIEVYFEDLEDKLEYVVNEIEMHEEHIDSIEDAFKSLTDIKMNSVMTILTIFSAFLLPLTLITSFYGMNIKLPFQDREEVVYSMLVLSIIIMIFFYIYFKKKDKI